MIPVKTSRTDGLLGDWPGAEPLPVTACVVPFCALSFWDLSPTERMAIAEGALVELHVNTRGSGFGIHPLVDLRVSTEPRELEPLR